MQPVTMSFEGHQAMSATYRAALQRIADDAAAGGGDALEIALEALRAPSCSCASAPFIEGPATDCPEHGAVRAFSEASAELERLRAESDRRYETIVRLGREQVADRDELERVKGIARRLADLCETAWFAPAAPQDVSAELAKLRAELDQGAGWSVE